MAVLPFTKGAGGSAPWAPGLDSPPLRQGDPRGLGDPPQTLSHPPTRSGLARDGTVVVVLVAGCLVSSSLLLLNVYCNVEIKVYYTTFQNEIGDNFRL